MVQEIPTTGKQPIFIRNGNDNDDENDNTNNNDIDDNINNIYKQ